MSVVFNFGLLFSTSFPLLLTEKLDCGFPISSYAPEKSLDPHRVSSSGTSGFGAASISSNFNELLPEFRTKIFIGAN